jgi:hypothetical protein
MRIHPIFFLLIATTGTLGAQPAPAPTSACGYDECALRQDGNRIKRGLTGVSVAKMGVFSATSLVSIVQGDSATAYGHVFDKEYRRGIRRLWLGLAVTEIPLLIVRHRVLRSRSSLNSTDGVLIGTAVGGVVVTHLGGRALRRARTAASQSIWWHNRSLPR